MVTILSKYGEYILVVLTVGFLFAPVIYYLFCGWVARKREILGNFSENAVKNYFNVFFYTESLSQDHLHVFRKLHDKRFGRCHFLVPGVCLFLVSGFVLVLVSWTVLFWLREESNHRLVLPPIAVAAVAGAYMWVLQDFIRRSQRRDLTPTDLFWAYFRFLIATPFGFAIAALFKDDSKDGVGLALAFLLGTFPTRQMFVIGRWFVTVKLFPHLGKIRKETSSELMTLQGIRKVQAERFADEGVESILQLAYSDPIDLTMRTNFSFSYVVDCCSQALAWLYFGQDLTKMWRFGIRGGQEIYSIISEIDNKDTNKTREKEQAEKCLEEISKEIGLDRVVVERTMREIAEDPYTLFLCNVWCVSETNGQN
jgi:hypothetical protein